jgi:hypothetical protein
MNDVYSEVFRLYSHILRYEDEIGGYTNVFFYYLFSFKGNGEDGLQDASG